MNAKAILFNSLKKRLIAAMEEENEGRKKTLQRHKANETEQMNKKQ